MLSYITVRDSSSFKATFSFNFGIDHYCKMRILVLSLQLIMDYEEGSIEHSEKQMLEKELKCITANLDARVAASANLLAKKTTTIIAWWQKTRQTACTTSPREHCGTESLEHPKHR